MKRYSPIPQQEPEINLTPLIDVVFVVLIMFIIIAPILEKDRIELSRNTKAQSEKITHNSNVTIHINKENQILLNKKLIHPNLLENALKRLKIEAPNSIPQIFYDKKAYFEHFEIIKQALEKAGFSDMDLVLEPGQG